MAIIKVGEKQAEVNDGTALIDKCEEMDVSFGCREGICSTCEIKIISGMENLIPLTDNEKDFELEDGHRLTCQCVIEKGKVELTPA